MPKGSGDAEAKGRASKLDAGHVKIVWLDHRRKVCSDAKGMMTVQSVIPREEIPTDNYALLKNQQQ